MFKILTTTAIILCLATTAASAEEALAGNTAIKFRGGIMHITNSKGGAVLESKLKGGMMGEVAFAHFVSNNFSVEGSLGYARSKGSFKSTVAGWDVKNKKVSIVPVTILAQYNIAADAFLNPYFGIGMTYQLVSGKGTVKDSGGLNWNYKYKNGAGIVGQIGLDVMVSDNIGLNIDVKHVIKLNHDMAFTYPGLVTVNIKDRVSTTSILAGVVFTF